MYPAASAVAADLPDAITLLGVGSLAKSGTDYGDTTNGVILESGVWARYLAGVRSTKACLIDDDGNLTPEDDVVEDQFPGILYYTITDPSYGEKKGSLTRVSLCFWEDIESPLDDYMFYNQYNLFWEVQLYGDFRDYAGVKEGSQNSPLGDYFIETDGSPIGVTISDTP